MSGLPAGQEVEVAAAVVAVQVVLPPWLSS